MFQKCINRRNSFFTTMICLRITVIGDNKIHLNQFLLNIIIYQLYIYQLVSRKAESVLPKQNI